MKKASLQSNVRLVFFALVTALSSVACGSPNTLDWTEEVQLSNGAIIQVRHIRQGKRAGEIARPSWIITRTDLKILQSGK